MSAPGFDPTIVKMASQAQRQAAHPDRHVFVEANAGSGKTRVLVDRVARLLLEGASPERILCVTFTKAAAGEMQTRLFKKLGAWSTLDDDDLAAKLTDLDPDAEPDRDRLAQARRLFARALETPGGLKVQTIHAFCERILRQFPLEAGLPPGFETQEGALADEAKAEARQRLLLDIHQNADGLLGQAITTLLDKVGPSGLESLISFAGYHRFELEETMVRAGSTKALMDQVSAILEVSPQLTERDAKVDAWMETPKSDLAVALVALRDSATKTDQAFYEGLRNALDAGRVHPVVGIDTYIGLFLTQKGDPRKQLFTKGLGKTFSILETLFGEDGSERSRIVDEVLPALKKATTNELSRAGIVLAERWLTHYNERLQRTRRIDFADLVERARRLLTDAEARDWVLYKLDQGLDHILVDEAQDTSPEQWDVIRALMNEFFSGEGKERSQTRTVFFVGDEKQSIYSFQKADPKIFMGEGRTLKQRAEDAGQAFDKPPLRVSFRSCEEVLSAVDLAFAKEQSLLEIDYDAVESSELEVKYAQPDSGPILAFQSYTGHDAARRKTPGCVEIWPAIPNPKSNEDETTDEGPVDSPALNSARNQLAEAVAEEISQILQRGDRVWKEGDDGWTARPAHAGDILVLVRKRAGGLFDEIIRRLKLKSVPVAGADRLTLSDQLIVEDLLSLARFALLPEDDISLAEILKSPLFHSVSTNTPITDDDLFTLSQTKGRRLWDKLRSQTSEPYKTVRAVLDDVRSRVDTDTPYVFFSRFLNSASLTGETYLSRIFARLGEEARDPLEAFLTRAMDHEQAGAPSLARFVAELTRDESDIKREMTSGAREVRVMTVHGAKGLEAPIVFLPDSTQLPSDRSDNLFTDLDAGLIWAPDKASCPPVLEARRENEKAETQAENDRLLYVALTRARDRLIVCGACHGSAPGRVTENSWHDRLSSAWQGDNWNKTSTALHNVAERNGWEAPPALRYGKPPPALGQQTGTEQTAIIPDWVNQAVPSESRTVKPMAPSRLLDEAESQAIPVTSPIAQAGPDRFLRGSLIHKLLETLPDVPEARRAQSGERYLQSRPELSSEQRDDILKETLGILDHDNFAALFGPGSRAEVSISGHPPGLPDTVRVNGQIDRLVITDHEVLIIDYKTNRPPPRSVADVPSVYLGQMAAYRSLLQALHPDKHVRCALLWTDIPDLMELPDGLLDKTLKRASTALSP